MFKIQHGPFKGVEFTQSEAYVVEAPGETPKAGIYLAALNQRFLDVFAPQDGWGVAIAGTAINVDMFPLDRPGEFSTEAVPCVRFDAELFNPQGRSIIQASTIWTIKGPKEWERGETNARQRLYEAAGLQSRFDIPPGAELQRFTQPQGGTAKTVAVRTVKTGQDDDVIPMFEPVVDDEHEEETEARVHKVLAVVEEVFPASPVAAAVTDVKVEPVAAVDAPTVAVATSIVASSPDTESGEEQSAKPAGGKRGKRERLPDDAPAPQVLMEQAIRAAALCGRTVPDTVKTKAQVNQFLAAL